jgi:UDP-glucose 4-epimerase
LDRDLIEIYVPLDTKRDYIYSDDVGRKIAKLLEVTKSNDSPVIHKNIASQVNRTVSSVVAELNRIRGIRTPVIFATKRETFLQPKDLLFESTVFPEVETVSCISLAEGLQKVIANQLLTKQVSA